MEEGEDPLYSSYILNCVFNAFSSYTAIMLNIVTIHAIRKTPSLSITLKILLLSLAVSDLGVGLLVQPLYITMMVKMLQRNMEDDSFYPTLMSFEIITGLFYFASFFHVIAISVDRFLAIHLHLRYQELVTHKRVVAAVISIWLLSTFLSLIELCIPTQTSSSSSFMIFVAIIFDLCFICTAFVYCKIYFAVRRHTNQIQALQVQQAAQNGEMANVVRQRKSAVSTFYVYLVFLVCYLPLHFTFVAVIISGSNLTLTGLLLYFHTLVFINSSLNPVIYCWKLRPIRHAIMDMLRKIFPNLN
ncbi:adenosine receptor A3-like [Oculina patagonica]